MDPKPGTNVIMLLALTFLYAKEKNIPVVPFPEITPNFSCLQAINLKPLVAPQLGHE